MASGTSAPTRVPSCTERAVRAAVERLRGARLTLALDLYKHGPAAASAHVVGLWPAPVAAGVDAPARGRRGRGDASQ